MSRQFVLSAWIVLLLTACGGSKPYTIKNRFPYVGEGMSIDITDEYCRHEIVRREAGDTVEYLFLENLDIWRYPDVLDRPYYTCFIPRTQSGTFGFCCFYGYPGSKKRYRQWRKSGSPAFIPMYHFQIREDTTVAFSEIPPAESDAMPFVPGCEDQMCRRIFPGIYWDVFRMHMGDKQENGKTQQIYRQSYIMKYEENGQRDWYESDDSLLLHIPMSHYCVDTVSILEGTLSKRRLGFVELFTKQDFIMLDTIFDKLYKYPELDTALLSLPGKVFREEYLKGENR